MSNDSKGCNRIIRNNQRNKKNPLENIAGHTNPFRNPINDYLRDSLVNSGIDSASLPGKCFYDRPYDYGLDRGRCGHSYARITHLSPDILSVDIYLDGKIFYSGLSYMTQTDYVRVRPGNHRILIYQTNRNLIFYKTLYIPKRSIVSLIFYGTYNNTDVMIVDDKTNFQPGKSKIRFVHLLSGAPAFDLLIDRMAWFKNIIYQEGSDYITIPSGRESLKLRISGTKHVIFVLRDVQFKCNHSYTIYAINSYKRHLPLELFLTSDGEN